MKARDFQTIPIGNRTGQFEVMIYGETLTHRSPLLVLHSIEFPIPPSAEFCDLMWGQDLQVVFVRRAGYGLSSGLPPVLMQDAPLKNGATAIAEAAMLRKLISDLGLTNVKLLAVGSSNPVAFRLVQIAPEIEHSVFVNPIFNQTIWDAFSPPWFRNMVKQIVTSKSGLSVAIQGMKLLIRRDPISYYKHIFEKNLGDLEYVDNNRTDYIEGARLTLDISAQQLYYETHMCLANDPLLKDNFFEGISAAVMIGNNTTDIWRKEMARETSRLGLPLIRAPYGDIFCAYASPETLLEMFRKDRSAFVFENQSANSHRTRPTHT
ncbi:MAG: hypothetical protein AAF331_03375 [Pseudomonadota bacterium]